MGIENKIKPLHTWTYAEVQQVYRNFDIKYSANHKDDMFKAIINGTLDHYVERKARVFDRYAKCFDYAVAKRIRQEQAIYEKLHPKPFDPHKFP